MSDIFHIRLNTGEDLISEIKWPETKPGHEAHIILVSPMKIIAVPSTKAGFVQLSLMQWIFAKITTDKEFNVFGRDILTMSKPTDSLKEYYKETVHYFNKHNSNSIEDYLDNLEKEIQAVEDSDKMVEEGEITPELEDLIEDFLKSFSSNNKGTLH